MTRFPLTAARKILRAAAIPLLLAALPASLLADTLTGLVTDAETGLPISSVRVLLPGDDDGAALTDPEGVFRLDDVPSRPFTLVVAHLAYEARILAVQPLELAGAPLEIALAPAYYRGEKVVVSASRYGPSVHLTQSNLTREDIRRRQDEKDIPLLLSSTPGLHACTDAGNGVGYTYLRLRGFDQKRVGVMVNGIPLNDPEDHQVYWVDLPDLASSLEDVQVQRGITNSLGGMSAIGGTVNLVTEVLGPEAGGHFTLASGSYGTNKQTLSYQSGQRGRFASGLRISHLESDGYRMRSGSDQWGVFWSGRYTGERSATQVNIYTGHELSHHAWDGLSEEQLADDRRQNPEAYENAIDDFRQPHYELHHRLNMGESAVLKSSLYWIHGEGFYENFKDDRRAEDFSLDLHLGLDPDDEVDLIRRKHVEKNQYGLVSKLLVQHARGRLVLGGDVYDFHSRHWGDLQSVEGFTAEQIAGLPHYYEYEGDKVAWSVYANEQLEIGGGLTALVDLHYQRKGYDFLQKETGNFRGLNRNAYSVDYEFFNPKGGLYWRAPGAPLGGELGLYGHVGVAHREPSDDELFDTWQGPDDLGATPLFAEPEHVVDIYGVRYVRWSDPLVKEERVLNYELGAAWRGERLSFAVNGYRMDFENEIVPYGARDEDGHAIKGNAERTLHQGVELGLTAQLGDRHSLQLAASKSWDEYADFTVYEDQWDWDTWEYLGTVAHDYSGNPIALFPEHLFSATIDSELGPVSTSLRLRGAGRQHLDNTGDEQRTIDAYQAVDLGVALAPAQLGLPTLGETVVSLRVVNALDTEYETYGYYDPWGAGNYMFPAAGRHFLLGVRHEF